jgi:hypothetical protein
LAGRKQLEAMIRQPNTGIDWIGPSNRQTNSLGIRFSSRQSGSLDRQTGDFTFEGQN